MQGNRCIDCHAFAKYRLGIVLEVGTDGFSDSFFARVEGAFGEGNLVARLANLDIKTGVGSTAEGSDFAGL